MDKGDIVMIYDDPITKERPEGKARLKKKLQDNYDQEYWEVEFISDQYTADRWITTK